MNLCSYIRHFNVLMSFVESKKGVESMLKDNATAFSEPENMLFGPKYKELIAKSLSSKNRSKELFGTIKNQGSPKEGNRWQSFRKDPYLKPEGTGGVTAVSQNLQLQYLQEDKEGVRMNLLIASPINSTNLLSSSELYKIHPLVVNLFQRKIKQLPRASRVKHFVKHWKKLTNNPMVLDVVTCYIISFILPPKQSGLPNLCQLTKEMTDLVEDAIGSGCYSKFGF